MMLRWKNQFSRVSLFKEVSVKGKLLVVHLPYPKLQSQNELPREMRRCVLSPPSSLPPLVCNERRYSLQIQLPLMDLNTTFSSPPWLRHCPSPPLPLFHRPTSFSTSSSAALLFVSRQNLDIGRHCCGPAPLPSRSLPKDARVEAELRPGGWERSGMRRVRKMASMVDEIIPPESFVVVSACVVGLLTGLGVVVFNITVICSYPLIFT